MPPVLALNISSLFLSILVSGSVIVGNYHRRSTSFYVLIGLLIIPILAQIRQLLTLYNLLKYVPIYLLFIYLLLRLIGPLINYHVHLQLERKFNFLSWINLITYLAFIYIIFISVQFLLSDKYGVGELLSTFKEDNIFAITYPILQLLHVGQALYLLQKKSPDTKKGLAYFMKTCIIVVLITLLVLQLGYFLFDRFTVEFIVAPIIFLIIYSAILFISIRYSMLFESPPSPKTLPILSQRENEVLQKLIAGKTDKEIADELHLSVNTIATYCRRIYTKLEVKNRTEATKRYLDF